MSAAGGVKRLVEEKERARAAWLLAIDLADEASGGAGGPGFLKVYDMPAKRGRGSTGDLTVARRVALYLATTVADLPCRALGAAAGVHPATVAYHVERVADLRDEDGGFDRLIEGLEKKMVFRAASLVMAALRTDLNAGEGADHART